MSERKYPHLSNEQLIKLLGCVRIMNHKNYPDEFKDVPTPYGHDLIDAIVDRLRGGQSTSIAEVDLNFLFRNNHDLRTYITAALTDFRSMVPDLSALDRKPGTIVDEVLAYIEEHHLVMNAVDWKMTLFFALDVRTHGLAQCGTAPDWSITQQPLKEVPHG